MQVLQACSLPCFGPYIVRCSPKKEKKKERGDEGHLDMLSSPAESDASRNDFVSKRGTDLPYTKRKKEALTTRKKT